MPAIVQKKMFTADEYHRMAGAGIFGEDDHIELIEGEIVRMAAIGSRHAACVGRLTQLFVTRFLGKAIVWGQNPVRIGNYSEPEPDIALLNPREDFYARSHPGPGDVLLIVEVSDSSLEYDREVKLPLYAKAGIREVWIVNLKTSCVEVHTNPSGNEYQNVRIFHRGSVLRPGVFPDAEITVDEIIGQEYPLTV
jgi:Uma2 family endonuclease